MDARTVQLASLITVDLTSAAQCHWLRSGYIALVEAPHKARQPRGAEGMRTLCIWRKSIPREFTTHIIIKGRRVKTIIIYFVAQ